MGGSDEFMVNFLFHIKYHINHLVLKAFYLEVSVKHHIKNIYHIRIIFMYSKKKKNMKIDDL